MLPLYATFPLRAKMVLLHYVPVCPSDDIGVFLLNTIWRKEGKCMLPLSVYSGAKYGSVL